MMGELEKIRSDIDLIDCEIVKLFEQRMEIVLKVARHKEKLHMPILYEGREQEVLTNCKETLINKELTKDIEELYLCLLNISKKAQARLFLE